jgi:hypothetical protein
MAGLTVLRNTQPGVEEYIRKSAIVSPETMVDWKSEELKIIDRYQPKDMFNVDETGLFHNLQPSKTLTYIGDSCHGGTKSWQRVTVLLSCSADVMEKLPALVTGKYNKPHCFRNGGGGTPHQIHSKF